MASAVVCRPCGEERIRRWRETRAQNGLTETEWPEPVPPEFRGAVELARHTQRVHR